MNDAGKIIYTPLWLRLLSILVLSAALIVAFAAVYFFMHQPERETYVLTAMALAQVAASGLVLVLIVFYSRREVGMTGMRKRNDAVLAEELPNALRKMVRHAPFGRDTGKPVTLKVDYEPGDVMAGYEIAVNGATLRMRVTFNVRRMVVIYFFPCAEPGTEKVLEKKLEGVITGAENAGYTAKVRFNPIDYKESGAYNTLFFYNNALPDDFLLDPLHKLFWLTDVAIMTRSIMLEILRQKIDTTIVPASAPAAN
ncbi:MAG: hypothetical protein ACXIVG_12005 [Pararhodobacter sp.]